MSEQTEQSGQLARLLFRTGEGDARAFAELYEQTSARLLGVCLRMLRDRPASEEVLQDVFVTVWRRARQFDAALSAPTTWLITLARNKAIDRLRQRRALLPLEAVDFDTLSDERPTPPVAAEASQEYTRLQRCLETLEAKDRHSIREAFFSGATYKELADRSRVPLGTVKSRIRRALAQLRTCLEP
jgi:RNA polymerase sigma factor (sigma-70 family)